MLLSLKVCWVQGLKFLTFTSAKENVWKFCGAVTDLLHALK
jgi:hypothetical protein